MKFINSILALSTALMVFLTSNGFVYEYYFCQHCHEEHKEISLFEFGEISHNHKCMEHSHGHHDECHHHGCKKDCDCINHLDHTHVTFFSLKHLFYGENSNPLPMAQITQQLFVASTIFATSEYYSCSKYTAINKAPPKAKTLHDGTLSPSLSCFRL